MVKLINWLTGTEMWVAEDRVEEYLAAGHKKLLDPKKIAPKKTRKKTAKESR